jgi:tRNA (cmo5U34)-methyltransferase
MNKNKKIDVGSNIQLQQETWSFADSIDHFDSHILQSVPHCQEQREYIAALSKFFLYPGSQAYEIGVSTGGLAQAVLTKMPERNFSYIGLDLESEMVEQAQARLHGDKRFQAIHTNASDYDFAPASLIISYYTLQFVPPDQRMTLLKRLYQALTPGGALILYEKTLAENAQLQDMLNQLYLDFKADHGLSADAILNKALALRGVSLPLTLAQNKSQLELAGFKTTELIYRTYCFAGFLALKEAFCA